MKIAIFVHCFFPAHFYGTETYTLDLARRLREMGHDATVVAAIFQGEPAQDHPIERYEFQGVPVISIDKNSFPHRDLAETYFQPSMGPILREILEDLQPDVVHVTHLINHTAVLLEEVRRLGIPIVATLTDFFGFCFTNKLEAANGSLCAGPSPNRSNCVECWLKDLRTQPGFGRVGRILTTGPARAVAAGTLVRAARMPKLGSSSVGGAVRGLMNRPGVLANAYQAYSAVITPTRFLRSAYEHNGLRVPAHDIHFGVDVAREAKPARSDSDPLTIGYIGQIASHKGVDLLVHAFTEAGSALSELHIFGPEDQDPGYMRKLRRAAEGHRVQFRGTFPEARMAAVLAELDLLVIPSRWYENSPLALLNALASHTPVLISDVAGMTEFVEDGRNGFTFERGNAGSLTRSLRAILDDPRALRDMSRTTEYPRTTRTMVEEVLPIYEQVITAA